jgi:hypothetical protein
MAGRARASKGLGRWRIGEDGLVAVGRECCLHHDLGAAGSAIKTILVLTQTY